MQIEEQLVRAHLRDLLRAAHAIVERRQERRDELVAEVAEVEAAEQAAGEARGSVEFLGIWKSRYQYEANSSASAMPTKMKGRGETDARVAFGKLVDELIPVSYTHLTLPTILLV